MIWPYDTSEPRITPEGLVEHYCEREGVSREQILLPPTLVATFQNAYYARLAEQTDAKVPPEFERRSSGGTALGARAISWSAAPPGASSPPEAGQHRGRDRGRARR